MLVPAKFLFCFHIESPLTESKRNVPNSPSPSPVSVCLVV